MASLPLITRRAIRWFWRQPPLHHGLSTQSPTGQHVYPPNTVRRLRRFFSASTRAATPMDLHLERIGPGNKEAAAGTNNPILFLHGLLGHGRNLKTFAKQACEVQGKEGYLMDLRGHGQSRLHLSNAGTTSSNHTFAACVGDIEHTVASRLAHNGPGIESTTLVGHSWGGRMALQYAHDQVSGRFNTSAAAVTLDRVWLLDTVPGQTNDSVERVISVVTKLRHEELGSKQDLVERLTKQEGLDMATAQWLASSYKGSGDFGFDLEVIQDILPEFGTQDFEGMVTTLLQNQVRVELVRGGKNKAWDVATLNRLESMQRQYPMLFGLHVLPKAGHWVHIDDVKGLVSLFETHL